jgi:hypothetical protein
MRGLGTLVIATLAFGAGAALSLTPVRGEGGAQVVATVGSEAVTAADLTAFLYARYRDSWVRTLEALLDERIVEHEAKRLGLVLRPGVLDRSLLREVEARRKQLAEVYGEEVRLEDEVQRGYGMDFDAWQQDVLRPRVRMQLLMMRVVRLDTRRRDRVQARVIVVDDLDRATRIRKRLESGADFSLTALQESVDPTAQAGGDLPAVARGDLTLPSVEAALFAAEPGDLVGPLAVTIAGQAQFHLYKVIQRLAPWTGTRAELLARLEEDLEATKIQRAEFERWRSRMRRDFRTRVFDPEGRPVVLPSLGN